jgi:hypothetical protein
METEDTSVARQRHGEHAPAATIIQAINKTVGLRDIYAVRVVSNIQYIVKGK